MTITVMMMTPKMTETRNVDGTDDDDDGYDDDDEDDDDDDDASPHFRSCLF